MSKSLQQGEVKDQEDTIYQTQLDIYIEEY